jgi:hypothetical protein
MSRSHEDTKNTKEEPRGDIREVGQETARENGEQRRVKEDRNGRRQKLEARVQKLERRGGTSQKPKAKRQEPKQGADYTRH